MAERRWGRGLGCILCLHFSSSISRFFFRLAGRHRLFLLLNLAFCDFFRLILILIFSLFQFVFTLAYYYYFELYVVVRLAEVVTIH